MSEEAQRIYREAFYKFLDQTFNTSFLDSRVENANLLFGPSNDINNNIGSKYFSVLNDFYFSSLTNEELITLENKRVVDAEVIGIVENTYKNSIRKDGVSGMMYEPPRPEHYVENGSLVLEFVYGKNIKKVPNTEYIKLYRDQKDFINSMIEDIKQDVENRLGINCEIFVDKRVNSNG